MLCLLYTCETIIGSCIDNFEHFLLFFEYLTLGLLELHSDIKLRAQGGLFKKSSFAVLTLCTRTSYGDIGAPEAFSGKSTSS